jgi:hypothetical protein
LGDAGRETVEVCTGFWWENVRERDHLKDLVVNGWIILKWIFKKLYGKAWTGMIWLRIGKGRGLL